MTQAEKQTKANDVQMKLYVTTMLADAVGRCEGCRLALRAHLQHLVPQPRKATRKKIR